MIILIAEDNAILQKSVGLLMKWWGFDFDLVSNGREAVEQAVSNNGNYDLALMDIDMPEMNGCEATRIIRKKVSYFPIMALSGHGGMKSWKNIRQGLIILRRGRSIRGGESL